LGKRKVEKRRHSKGVDHFKGNHNVTPTVTGADSESSRTVQVNDTKGGKKGQPGGVGKVV